MYLILIKVLPNTLEIKIHNLFVINSLNTVNHTRIPIQYPALNTQQNQTRSIQDYVDYT